MIQFGCRRRCDARFGRASYGNARARTKEVFRGVNPVRGPEPQGATSGRSALFAVKAVHLLRHADIADEVFGASSVVVRCADGRDLVRVLEHLEGQLTTSLHLEIQDAALAARLLPLLERKVGRLIANGWPKGVEVSHAMVHGGPFPAKSDGRSTSVGTLAIERFLRPVCYQDFPALLPEELRRSTTSSLPHRLDGAFVGDAGLRR
jgi:2,5-dioxopentanoate dehydrogenase